jgi:hypothetical protein
MPHAPLQRLPADVILDVLANGRVQSVLRRTLSPSGRCDR